MENLKMKKPIEIKNKAGWTTIELNENDLEDLRNHHPFIFSTGGNFKYMIIRVA